jgi:hypothetical protein
MHEIGLAQGVLDVALEAADGAAVTGIQLRVGEHHAIVPDAFTFSFALLADGTPAAGARLEIEPVAGDELLVAGVQLVDGTWLRPPDGFGREPVRPVAVGPPGGW